jgi:hypothetical protein
MGRGNWESCAKGLRKSVLGVGVQRTHAASSQ